MLKRKLPLLLLAAVTPWLTSCATASSSPAPSVCPRIVEYSKEFQGRLADEIQALPQGSALLDAMLDYRRLRGELRACQ